MLLEEQLRLSFALAGAKDNLHVESFYYRFKAEGHSQFLDARTIGELREVVERRIDFYNRQRYHSSLGYQAPLAFVRKERPELAAFHIGASSSWYRFLDAPLTGKYRAINLFRYLEDSF